MAAVVSIDVLRKYQEWEEREINRIIDERMANPAAGVPIEDVMRETLERSELETDPLGFNTTALVSQPDRRRLRVGDHRIIYTIDNGELVVWAVHVGHRSAVYDT